MMNPIFMDLGAFQITWYSALIALGAFIAYLLFVSEAKKLGINANFIANLFFWAFIFGLIGARLYYVIFQWSYYKINLSEIYQIWAGGLAIHGGILFGFIFLAFYCKKYKVKILRITDLAVFGLIFAQIIGRWGNFFNSEAYGSETTRKFLESMFIPEGIINGMNIYGTYYHPTFLYESFWLFIGLIILFIMRKVRYTKIGQITGVYLMWSSIGRFFIEILREDSLMLGPLKAAQFVSVILFIVGLVVFALSSKGSKFENLYGEKDGKDIRF